MVNPKGSYLAMFDRILLTAIHNGSGWYIITKDYWVKIKKPQVDIPIAYMAKICLDDNKMKTAFIRKIVKYDRALVAYLKLHPKYLDVRGSFYSRTFVEKVLGKVIQIDVFNKDKTHIKNIKRSGQIGSSQE